jgi:hypothetical protein
MHATPFLPGLSPVAGKSLTARRDAGNLTSNGGVLLLREAALKLDIAARIAKHIPDARNPLLVTHSYADMVLARAVLIAAGYEDCDDADALRNDPAFKMALGRSPETGADLMSQPTLSRIENTPDAAVLYRIGREMIDLFVDSYARAPVEIVLDIDDTDDLVHGGQQLALFNAHAGGHCFQPIHIFEAVTGKPVLSLLREGKRPSGQEIARVLRPVLLRIRRRWPKVRIIVRGDGHYCAPEVLALLRKMRCFYVLGLARNKTLDTIVAPWKADCDMRRGRHARKIRRFHTFLYGAESWAANETVIARVEATDLGSDARFIVTNLKGRSKHIYEKLYCARGRAENLIKDMKLHTRSDKTACSRWQANQFRLFLHQAAYWLLHALRLAAPRRSRWRGATFATIRTSLIKLAVRVEELKHSIKLSFAAHLPHADILSRLASRLTARGS